MSGPGDDRRTWLHSASGVLVEARSSVGLISFGSQSIGGGFEGRVVDGKLDTTAPIHVSVLVPVDSLQSGNALYDSELRTRLNVLRFPMIEAALTGVTDLGSGRYNVTGDLTIHGETRPQTGTATLTVEETPEPIVVIAGTAVVDMRDYGIELPHVLMLRIYPDVAVHFRVTAPAGNPGEGEVH
ncbi:MAG TPA: YceI family protein [Nocardioidaceae bacterium]|nr:YceI family protein [Nocardioidaceae bacterium]